MTFSTNKRSSFRCNNEELIIANMMMRLEISEVKRRLESIEEDLYDVQKESGTYREKLGRPIVEVWSPNKPVVEVLIDSMAEEEEKENEPNRSCPVILEQSDGINEYDLAPINYPVDLAPWECESTPPLTSNSETDSEEEERCLF